MSVYTVESRKGYPGPKEYKPGTQIARVGIYVESLVPQTNLKPYRLREIKDPELDKGYVLDGALDLGASLVWITPQVKDPAVIMRLLAQAMLANPHNPSPLKFEDFDKLAITHGYMRTEGGMKILIASDERVGL